MLCCHILFRGHKGMLLLIVLSLTVSEGRTLDFRVNAGMKTHNMAFVVHCAQGSVVAFQPHGSSRRGVVVVVVIIVYSSSSILETVRLAQAARIFGL